MKKPKWRIWFSTFKISTYSLRPRWYICKKLLWKEKYGTPRVETLPHYLFSWLWWQLNIEQGSDQSWEWYLWVEKFNNGDIEKAKETWPWYEYTDKTYTTKVKSQPWLKYK